MLLQANFRMTDSDTNDPLVVCTAFPYFIVIQFSDGDLDIWPITSESGQVDSLRYIKVRNLIG